MNHPDYQKVKTGILIAAFTVLFYLGLQHIDVVMQGGQFVLSLFSPFLIGICFAFVLNLLMRLYTDRVFAGLNRKNHPKWNKLRKPVCIILTVLTFLGILTALIAFIIPQLMDSVTTLGSNLSGYLRDLETFANRFLTKWGFSTSINQGITDFLTRFSDNLVQYLSSAVPAIFQTTVNVTSAILNLFLGFVISIYILASRDKLLRNLKEITYAVLPPKGAAYAQEVAVLANARFSGFVSGQLTEAVILGVLCFLGMSLFGMEYALLISMIIGLTNVIPIFGPIIGTIPGALILLMVEPMKAVWFVIFIVVLQQIESNLIYPRVVGGSIGLPGIWVMFSVLIGGSLFGLPGVLLGVPTFAVIYTLIARAVKKRLHEKKIVLR